MNQQITSPTVAVATSRPSPVTDAATAVINILTAAGWTRDEIAAYNDREQESRDWAYEADQMYVDGDVTVTAAEMRAEIRRLLVN